MYIWHIYRPELEAKYDETAAFVIFAETEQAARQLIADQPSTAGVWGDEGPDVWLDPNRSKAEALGYADYSAPGPRIVIRSFNAG